MGIGAAVGIGSAVAGLGGALISSSASKSAADTQAAAAQQASQNALAQYQQTRADVIPYSSQIGYPAGLQLSAMLQNLPSIIGGYAKGGLTFQPTQAQLAATPGYQFDLGQGLQAVQNSNAAQGLGVSGAALKGAANYATGLANNTLTTQQGIFQQNLANQLSPLYAQLSGLQNLASLGENAGVQSGQQGVQAVGNANQYLTGGAAAQAAGQVGSANALSSGLSSLSHGATNYLLYNQLFGSGGGGGYAGSPAQLQTQFGAGSDQYVP